MNTIRFEPFDASARESNLWLRSMMHHLGTEDRRIAYIALRATLHALRDRLEPVEAARLGARLPMLLRGLYFEAWRVDEARSDDGHSPGFIARVSDRIPCNTGIDPVVAARATAAMLHERLAPLEPPQ